MIRLAFLVIRLVSLDFFLAVLESHIAVLIVGRGSRSSRLIWQEMCCAPPKIFFAVIKVLDRSLSDDGWLSNADTGSREGLLCFQEISQMVGRMVGRFLKLKVLEKGAETEVASKGSDERRLSRKGWSLVVFISKFEVFVDSEFRGWSLGRHRATCVRDWRNQRRAPD